MRCDKQEPCTNCQKAGTECVFPSPGRAPRRSKKPPDAELLARLRRLEGVVQKLGKNGSGEDLIDDGLRKSSLNGTNGTGNGSPKATSPKEKDAPCPSGNPVKSPAERLDRFQQFHDIRGRESGQMVVGEGRSRYVTNGFWAGLTEEVQTIHQMATVFRTLTWTRLLK